MCPMSGMLGLMYGGSRLSRFRSARKPTKATMATSVRKGSKEVERPSLQTGDMSNKLQWTVVYWPEGYQANLLHICKGGFRMIKIPLGQLRLIALQHALS